MTCSEPLSGTSAKGGMSEPQKTQRARIQHPTQCLAQSRAAGSEAITITTAITITITTTTTVTLSLSTLGDILRLNCPEMCESALFFENLQHSAKGEGGLLHCY